jgi:hypothetical protein
VAIFGSCLFVLKLFLLIDASKNGAILITIAGAVERCSQLLLLLSLNNNNEGRVGHGQLSA